MDKSSLPWSLILLCFLYVWIGEHKAFGKCSGKWAIHACRGANGKRSDGTRISDDSDGLTRGTDYGLERLFLQHARNNLKKEALLSQLESVQGLQGIGEQQEYAPGQESELYSRNNLDVSVVPQYDDTQYPDPGHSTFPPQSVLIQKLIKLAQLKNSENI